MNNGLIKLGFTPDTDFMLQDDSDGNGAYISSWTSSDAQPSASAIATAETEWQTEYDSLEYSRARKAKYDALNQYEMMFDDQRDSTTTWVDAIDAIKAAHPKS
tara:strand:- start:17 stop:325 length:309 start_codon:yes stop_codon:yes gene_type:complete